MRILLTTHQFLPEFSSGTEVLTLAVARELRLRGHEVTVFTGYPEQANLQDANRFDTYDHEGLRVYRFRHAFTPMGGCSSVARLEYDNHLAAQYFRGILRDCQIDLVHYFHLGRMGSGLLDVANREGIPGFYTPTDFWAVCPTSQLLLGDGQTCDGPRGNGGNCIKHIATATRHGKYRSVLKRVPVRVFDVAAACAVRGLAPGLPRMADVEALSRRLDVNIRRLNTLRAILAPTRMMAETLLRHGVRQSILSQKAYGIDTHAFRDSPRSAPQDIFTFGFIGTLALHKGAHVLIQALRRLANPRLRLKLFGAKEAFPEYFEGLVRAAEGDERIEFCGTFANSQVGAVLDGIDSLVVPSVWYENAPLVVYSALAARCPVIASDYPGLSEAIQDRSNGLLFAPGDDRGLAACMQLLVSEPVLYERLSAGCRSPKTIEGYVDEVELIWKSAMESRTSMTPLAAVD